MAVGNPSFLPRKSSSTVFQFRDRTTVTKMATTMMAPKRILARRVPFCFGCWGVDGDLVVAAGAVGSAEEPRSSLMWDDCTNVRVCPVGACREMRGESCSLRELLLNHSVRMR